VLIVNDADSCDLIRFVLQLHEMEAHISLSASQAFEAFIHLLPDILISSISMPGEDGYSLLKKVRNFQPAEFPKVIAIAVTADVTQTEKKAIAAGFNKLLFKPIDIDELIAVISDLVKQEENSVCSIAAAN
jgi:CheY-like chemotaxis protein